MISRLNPSKEEFEAFYSTEDPWLVRRTPLELDKISKINAEFVHCRFREGIDLGCGEGDLLAGMSFIERKTGVDISDTAIARARQRYPNIGFRQGDLTQLDIEGRYDFVSCLESLYYLTDDEARGKAVQNIARLGTPNATFLFSVVIVGENEYRRYFTMEGALDLFREHFNIVHYFPTRLILTGRLGLLRYRLMNQRSRLAKLTRENLDLAYQCAFVCIRK